LTVIQTQGQKISLLENEARGHLSSTAVLQPQEEPTALESRGIEPGESPCGPFFQENWQRGGSTDGSSAAQKPTPFLVFSASPSNSEVHTISSKAQDGSHSEESALVSQLFGTQDNSGDGFSWDQTIFDFVETIARSGLQDGLRTQLLAKFELKKGLEALNPPKLNKLLLPVLKASSTVAKRDEYQLLANHQFRLSLARRAFIKPALNLLGKSTADLAPIDEWSFGSSFVEEVKDAQACGKVARSLRPTTALPKTTPQSTAKKITSSETAALGKRESPGSSVESAVSSGRGPYSLEESPPEIDFSLPPSPPLNLVRTTGRLANFYHKWETLTSDPEVLDAIRGYRIPFLSLPPSRPFLREPVFSAGTSACCDAEVERLLNKGAIHEVQSALDRFLSSFFLIEKSSEGLPFILNLKERNTYVRPPHFKSEDWRTVVRLLLPNVEMVSLDLKDAYLLISIDISHRKYLRFQWRGTTYEFRALLFGLATTPYIFTKILRPVVASLRIEGCASVLYLDDFLLLAHSRTACYYNVQAHISTLSELGFIINWEKSELEPPRRRKYLGFIFYFESQSVSIPELCRSKLYSIVLEVSIKTQCLIEEFANMIGSLVSVCPVKYGLLYTKAFERKKFLSLRESDNNFRAKLSISSELDEDFN